MAATIYFAGGEDVDFATLTNYAPNTSATYYRSAWAREGLYNNNGADTGVPPAHLIITPNFTSVSSLWLHFEVYTGWSSSNAANVVGFASPDGVWRLLVRQTSTNYQIKISTRNAAGTITDLATSAGGAMPSSAQLQSIDINVVFGSSGLFAVYLNGSNTPVVTYSGNILTDSATQLSKVFLGTAALGPTAYSEVIVSDTDTRAMGLFTMQPVAAGNTQVWTPNTVGNINPITINDSNSITDSNNGDISEWTCPTILPAGVWAVEAICQTVRMNKGVTGPQHFDFVTRPATGSTDYSSADVLGAAGLANYPYVWGTNPATSAPWVVADLATGFNLGIKAVT